MKEWNAMKECSASEESNAMEKQGMEFNERLFALNDRLEWNVIERRIFAFFFRFVFFVWFFGFYFLFVFFFEMRIEGKKCLSSKMILSPEQLNCNIKR